MESLAKELHPVFCITSARWMEMSATDVQEGLRTDEQMMPPLDFSSEPSRREKSETNHQDMSNEVDG
ncbi:hypothetical protein D3C83_151140 [compost metagenome]